MFWGQIFSSFLLFCGAVIVCSAIYFHHSDPAMTACVKAVFSVGIESKVRSFGSLYFKRLLASVSPLCLGINGTGTHLSWSAHPTFNPVGCTLLVGRRTAGLCRQSFSCVGGKLVSSPTVAVPRSPLRGTRRGKLLQGWAAWPGKTPNRPHLEEISSNRIQMFF